MTDCPVCGKPYERHPFINVVTCFLHPSIAERAWSREPGILPPLTFPA